MISEIRQILSEKFRLSGIRGCIAAGAVTAGIAAIAVIGGINTDDMSTVTLETDVIPDETAIADVTEKTEKRTYSHDMEYFSSEDIARMTSEDVEDSSENEEINEAASSDVVETEETAENNDVSEDTAESGYEAAEEESDETAYYEDDASSDEEISEDIDDNESVETEESGEPEENQENTESVSARSSAAGGDDDDSGLSSALDLEIEDAAVPAADYDEASETEDDVSEDAGAEENTKEEAAEAEIEALSESDDDDLDSIPEDITLDDADEEEEEITTGPQEDAISLLELPEWLSFDENGVPTEYLTVHTGKACAYTAAPDALMSTGKEVFQGYVAVDPDIIPYGSELYIVAEDGEVYGYAIAADTGYSVRKGHIIVDLFMNEYDDCIQWGNKPVNVYVLK